MGAFTQVAFTPLSESPFASSTPEQTLPFLPEVTLPQVPKILPSKTPPLVVPPASPIVTQPPAPIISAPKRSDTDLYTHALARTVNLLCERNNNETTIATAFFVHESGILLTNGHVTENLKDKSCIVRQGAPATEIGKASLLFLPSAYTSTSTYEGRAPHDISLWKYTPTENASVKPPLPIFSLSENLPSRGVIVTTFSYPAELVAFSILLQSQYPLFSDATISAHDHVSLALTSSAGAQKGSSGGVVMDPVTGSAIGIIFGVSDVGPIGGRTLYALTTERINAIMLKETGLSFAEYIHQLANNELIHGS